MFEVLEPEDEEQEEFIIWYEDQYGFIHISVCSSMVE